MRRVRTSALIAATAAVMLATAGPDAAATGTRIVGTWYGQMRPTAGSHVARHPLTIVVYRGERAGTWMIGPRCRGTLRLKNISNGYHHYTEVAAPGTTCAGGGVDCLKRVGPQVLDEFVSRPGTAANSTGRLRHAG